MDKIIAWLDVETGGIDPTEYPLLQVACILTNMDLEKLTEDTFAETVYFSEEEVEALKIAVNDYVREMHTKTGLWDSLSSGLPLDSLDQKLYDFISAYGEEKQVLLGGNSITLDRNFINTYLPKTATYLSYQSIDVTSIALLAEAWYDGLHFEKKYTHDAVQDIEESLEQLRFFRKEIFK